MAVITISQDYQATMNDELILVDTMAATGPITITLPDTHPLGKRYYIKDKSGAAEERNVRIVSQTPDTIDLQPEIRVYIQFQCIIVHSDGTNWSVL